MTRASAAGIIVALLAGLTATPSEAARGRITCSSNNYRFNSCRVDTENQVRLIREISTGNRCRQGRSWGFDNRSIWVDRGCRAEFEFGRWSNNSNNSNNSAAIAAGVLGAFALGSIIASIPPAAAPPPGFAPPPVTVAPTAPPGWAVGSFLGWDPEVSDTVQIIIDARGRVWLRNGVGVVVNEGSFRDGLVHWRNGRRSWLAREGPGIMLGDVDSGQRFTFRRS
jgi:hypothetical protein